MCTGALRDVYQGVYSLVVMLVLVVAPSLCRGQICRCVCVSECMLEMGCGGVPAAYGVCMHIPWACEIHGKNTAVLGLKELRSSLSALC